MRGGLWMVLIAGIVANTESAMAQEASCAHVNCADCWTRRLEAARWRDRQEKLAASYWRRLTRAERNAWHNWVGANPVALEDGIARRVSGIEALGIVLQNRARAGEPANPGSPPAAVQWLGPVLSMRDAGPFTVNAGFVGFRVERELREATRWFIWATPPLEASANDPECHLNFIGCLTLPPSAFDELTPSLGPQYLVVNGSWDGPDLEGAWREAKFVWFRVHQYVDGQLGPGVLLKGRIQVKL